MWIPRPSPSVQWRLGRLQDVALRSLTSLLVAAPSSQTLSGSCKVSQTAATTTQQSSSSLDLSKRWKNKQKRWNSVLFKQNIPSSLLVSYWGMEKVSVTQKDKSIFTPLSVSLTDSVDQNRFALQIHLGIPSPILIFIFYCLLSDAWNIKVTHFQWPVPCWDQVCQFWGSGAGHMTAGLPTKCTGEVGLSKPLTQPLRWAETCCRLSDQSQDRREFLFAWRQQLRGWLVLVLFWGFSCWVISPEPFDLRLNCVGGVESPPSAVNTGWLSLPVARPSHRPAVKSFHLISPRHTHTLIYLCFSLTSSSVSVVSGGCWLSLWLMPMGSGV